MSKTCILTPLPIKIKIEVCIRANENVQKRHKRTFSEDERIQAQENVKKVEDEDSDDISEPENELMLGRDAKDWKVCPVHSPVLPITISGIYPTTRPTANTSNPISLL